MVNFSIRQWNTAFLLAFILHISLFITITSKPPSTAKEAGLQGIEIGLGPAGGIPAPIIEELVEAPVEEKVVKDEVIEEETTEEVIEEPEPEIVQKEIEPEPVPEKPVEKPVEIKKEAEVVLKKKKVEIAPPVTKKVEPVKPENPIQEKVNTQPEKKTRSGSMALSGTKDKKKTDDGSSTSGGGVKGASSNYIAILQSWLEKHKKYPRRAQRKGQEGIVMLYFKMDKQGNVLNYRIKESSGYTQLDKEVEAMIKRAQPLPRIPDDMNKDTLELIVPVQFQIR